MSSRPSEPVAAPEEADPRPPARGWETWRRTMFAGGLVLLANAVAEALMTPDQPQAIKLFAQFLGYGLLAAGFGLRMRSRGQK